MFLTAVQNLLIQSYSIFGADALQTKCEKGEITKKYKTVLPGPVILQVECKSASFATNNQQSALSKVT